MIALLVGTTTVGMNDVRFGESGGVIGVWNETGIRGRTAIDISRDGRFRTLGASMVTKVGSSDSSYSISKSPSESTSTLLRTVCESCVLVACCNPSKITCRREISSCC